MPIVNDMEDAELARKLLDSIADAPNGMIMAVPVDDPIVVLEVRRYDGTPFRKVVADLKDELALLAAECNRLQRLEDENAELRAELTLLRGEEGGGDDEAVDDVDDDVPDS